MIQITPKLSGYYTRQTLVNPDTIGLDEMNRDSSELTSVIAGRFYLVAFTLRTFIYDPIYLSDQVQYMQLLGGTLNYLKPFRRPVLPKLISVTTNPGLSLTQLAFVAGPASPASELGTWLYGGYCTANNSSWGFSASFAPGPLQFFSYLVDEVQGSTTSPVLQTTSSQDNTASFTGSVLPGNSTYLVATSLLPRAAYPNTVGTGWTLLSTNNNLQNAVPNLFSGFSSSGQAPSWGEGNANLSTVNRTTITAELQQAP